MALIPEATKFCTRSTCWLLSFSRSGPRQTTSNPPTSWRAFSAPAWTDFQNSWLVPLGITAILGVELVTPEVQPVPRRSSSKIHE